MRRAMRLMLVGAMLAGCPSTTRNQPAPDRDAGDERVADVGGTDAAGDADAGDADASDAMVDVSDGASDVADASEVGDAGDAGVAGDAGDAPGVQMTIEFSSAGLSGPMTGGVQMRANITWHGALRGDAGGVSFEGEIR